MSENERYTSYGSFPRGCHGALAPTDLADGYFHRGVNLSVRDGNVSTRPRFKHTYTLQGSGTFNGAFVYSLNDGDRLVYGRGANVRVLDLWDGTDREVATLSDAPMYFTQADRYCIVQDGVSRPAILHESSLLRYAAPYQDPAPEEGNEVYTGTVMAYGHGRIFLVPRYLHTLNGVPDPTQTGKPYWVAGSILEAGDPETVLKFGESQYLAGGLANALPFESGYVQGLAFFQNAASGNGIGPLLVFGRRGVTAVSVNVPRTNWLTADFSQVLFTGPGTRSPKSLVPVNNDLMFRALDGIRSVRLTAAQAQGQNQAPLAVVPVSHEVSHRLALDASADLPHVSMSFADNRVLMTVAGNGDGTFRGLLSLDTSPMSTMGQSYPPAFDDLWTGLSFRQVLAGRVGDNELPEHIIIDDQGRVCTLSETETLDLGVSAPECRLYYPATMGGGKMRNVQDLVRFAALDTTFRRVRGPLEAKVLYRADEYPRWAETQTFRWTGDAAHEVTLPRVTFSFLDETGCAMGMGLVFGRGRTVQPCLQWTGVATLSGSIVRMVAQPLDPEVSSACSEGAPSAEQAPQYGDLISPNDFEYLVP